MLIHLRGWLRAIPCVILACTGTLLFAGCAVDPEEKAFFYGGWRHPQTDADEERHVRESATQSSDGVRYKKDPLVDE